MPTVLLTGFPGFLGSELLPRILARAPDTSVACLVQPKFLALAQQRIECLVAGSPTLDGRIVLVEGDITQPNLGLDAPLGLQRQIEEIYHLAAVYDLSVPRPVGMRVNVGGTRHVLDFADGCPSLQRLHYVSTCYVSGRYKGRFGEDDLDVGQGFKNYYEETKFLAEVEVQRRMRAGLPTTIYRPAIVVGDSHTGATQKYDGPYFVIRWLLRQPRVALLPVVGDTHANTLNVVPRDYVIEAISCLSALPSSRGKVYQLADPTPLTIDAMVREIGRATRRHIVRLPLPLSVAKGAIQHVPGVYQLMRIPAAAIDYFVYPTRYATDNAERDLAGSGICVPPFSSYVDRLVSFMCAHPEISSQAMV